MSGIVEFLLRFRRIFHNWKPISCDQCTTTRLGAHCRASAVFHLVDAFKGIANYSLVLRFPNYQQNKHQVPRRQHKQKPHSQSKKKCQSSTSQWKWNYNYMDKPLSNCLLFFISQLFHFLNAFSTNLCLGNAILSELSDCSSLDHWSAHFCREYCESNCTSLWIFFFFLIMCSLTCCIQRSTINNLMEWNVFTAFTIRSVCFWPQAVIDATLLFSCKTVNVNVTLIYGSSLCLPCWTHWTHSG